jgi:orf78
MEVKSMNFNNFQNMCKEKVVDYFNNRVEKTDDTKITIDDVFVVWYCKTLQNAKALLSTTVSDGMYYELTYNGDKNELYLDAYKKWENKKYDVK